MILLAQATFNVNAGYMPVDTIILFTLCYYLFTKLYYRILSFTMGSTTQAIESLQKELLLISKSLAIYSVPTAMLIITQ